MKYNYTEAEILDELGMLDNQDYEYEDEDEAYEELSIPDFKLSFRERMSNWYSTKKKERENKKEDRIVKLAKTSENFIDWCYRRREARVMRIAEREFKKETRAKRRQEVKENCIEWFYSRRAEKQLRKNERDLNKESGIYDKKDLVKSYAKCALKGALVCASAAGALIAATSVFTIGFLPAFVSTCALFGSYKLFNSSYKEEVKDLKQVKEYCSLNKEKSENSDQIKKEGFFSSLKRCFKKSNKNEIEDEISVGDKTYTVLTQEELDEDTIDVKNLVVSGDVSKVKLTREQKLAKVKEECKLARIRINDVTSYCVFVAKDDIKLQKFIRSEYRKENPEEKIQSFEMGNEKVLVLANRPNFK